MTFKLSPMLKYNIIFWTFTMPMAPYVMLLAMFAIVTPFYRIRIANWVEQHVYKLCDWRNNIPVIKYHHDKAYLFDMLKNSKG